MTFQMSVPCEAKWQSKKLPDGKGFASDEPPAAASVTIPGNWHREVAAMSKLKPRTQGELKGVPVLASTGTSNPVTSCSTERKGGE